MILCVLYRQGEEISYSQWEGHEGTVSNTACFNVSHLIMCLIKKEASLQNPYEELGVCIISRQKNSMEQQSNKDCMQFCIADTSVSSRV